MWSFSPTPWFLDRIRLKVKQQTNKKRRTDEEQGLHHSAYLLPSSSHLRVTFEPSSSPLARFKPDLRLAYATPMLRPCYPLPSPFLPPCYRYTIRTLSAHYPHDIEVRWLGLSVLRLTTAPSWRGNSLHQIIIQSQPLYSQQVFLPWMAGRLWIKKTDKAFIYRRI